MKIKGNNDSTRREKLKDKVNLRLIGSYALYGSLIVASGMLLNEVALADNSKFDLDAGIKAATSPLVNGLKTHWGKGVLLSGGATALIGEGDLRQRAVRAAIGSGAAGVVVLGLLAMLVA